MGLLLCLYATCDIDELNSNKSKVWEKDNKDNNGISKLKIHNNDIKYINVVYGKSIPKDKWMGVEYTNVEDL